VSDDATLIDESDVNYAERVGERLRTVRKRLRLSLQAVETQSTQEFKASVLGAYERGERAISVPRLQRLARFYGVSVDQLLPEDEDPAPAATLDLRAQDSQPTRPGPTADGRVTVDLRRLSGLSAPERELLGRYLGMIQLQRHADSGYMITIRQEDLRAIACLLETTAEGARRRLEDLGSAITVGSKAAL
jgi:transcriptional regulator with XRE-family HTH domain